MRKFRCDAKPINLETARQLYESGLSLAAVAKVFNVHHTNLMFRFRRFDIPIRTKSEALRGKPGKKGELNPAWKGGYTIEKRGYVVNNRTKKRFHQEIGEKILGRPLKKNERVHHIDGDGSNNEHQNLLICTHAYHQWLHAKIKKLNINIKEILSWQTNGN